MEKIKRANSKTTLSQNSPLDEKRSPILFHLQKTHMRPLCGALLDHVGLFHDVHLDRCSGVM